MGSDSLLSAKATQRLREAQLSPEGLTTIFEQLTKATVALNREESTIELTYQTDETEGYVPFIVLGVRRAQWAGSQADSQSPE